MTDKGQKSKGESHPQYPAQLSYSNAAAGIKQINLIILLIIVAINHWISQAASLCYLVLL